MVAYQLVSTLSYVASYTFVLCLQLANSWPQLISKILASCICQTTIVGQLLLLNGLTFSCTLGVLFIIQQQLATQLLCYTCLVMHGQVLGNWFMYTYLISAMHTVYGKTFKEKTFLVFTIFTQSQNFCHELWHY